MYCNDEHNPGHHHVRIRLRLDSMLLQQYERRDYKSESFIHLRTRRHDSGGEYCCAIPSPRSTWGQAPIAYIS